MRSLLSYGQCDAGRQLELSETCKRDAKELAVLVTAQTRCDAQWLSDGAFFLHRRSRHLKHPGVVVNSEKWRRHGEAMPDFGDDAHFFSTRFASTNSGFKSLF